LQLIFWITYKFLSKADFRVRPNNFEKDKFMKKTIALGLVSAVLMLSACGSKDEAAAGGEEKTATAEAGGEATAAPAAAGGTGVPECDQMYAKVEACLKDKVPAAQRGPMDAAFKQSKEQLAAVTDKAQMATMCKTQMEQAKTAYKAMGCEM
jgi:hypothetical protein